MTTRRHLLRSLSGTAGLAALAARGSARPQVGGAAPEPGRDPLDDPGQDWPTFSLAVAPPLPEPLAFGVGFNWFDHLGAGGFYARNRAYPLHEETYPDLADEAAWGEIRGALDEMRPGLIRFGLPPDPHVGPDGSFRGGTVHLRRLAWLDGWARAHGAVVLLDTFVIPQAFEFPLPTPPPTAICNMAAADNAAYARRFVAPLVRHVVGDLGLESVRLFNPVNEPMSYGVYQTPAVGPDVLRHYVDMYREMRHALDEAGVARERVGLVGCDAYTEDVLFLPGQMARGIDLDAFVDLYSVHYYSLRFDHLPPSEGSWTRPIGDLMADTARQVDYCRQRGKRLIAAEIGTFYYGWRMNDPAGPATPDATLTVAEGVVRGMNAGLGGFAFWSLMNPDTIDGWWGVVGLDATGKLRHRPHPWGVYGLLSQVARPGSTVHPLRDAERRNLVPIHATALVAPSGEATILLVSNEPARRSRVEIPLPEALRARRWSRVTTDRVRIRESLPDIAPADPARLQAVLNPFSLTVLRGAAG